MIQYDNAQIGEVVTHFTHETGLEFNVVYYEEESI